MNWQSHDLIAARLIQAQENQALYRNHLAAGWILANRDLCWSGLLREFPDQLSDVRLWALDEMASWVLDDEDYADLPEFFHVAVDKHRAAKNG